MLPCDMPFSMRAMNSENRAGFACADGAVVVFVLVFVFDVVVVEPVVEVFEVVVKPAGGGGMPKPPTRPGAAVRNCSMPASVQNSFELISTTCLKITSMNGGQCTKTHPVESA